MKKSNNVPRRYARYAEIIFQEDASGWQTFSYGKLGEVTENIRTFAPPFENQTYTFNMYFEYDSWNRIQIITYPDGEKVSYDYNLGGMLERVTGDKDSEHNEYVHHIEYNPFEQKEAVFYGNGTSAYYKYDVLLRLSHLRSVCADGTMQDIDYDYDEVSNISKIVNYAGMLPTGLGGTYDSQFSYDNLYRLISANGEWHGNNDLYYETSMDYEANGRISRKVLYADTWLDGNYATENYDNEYYYVNSGQPNTLSTINEDQQSFEWDLKGNMVFHYNGHSGYNRSLCWDEQNRLLGVKDDEQRLSYYLYDANGDRTCKFTGEYAAQNQSGQWHYYYLLNCPTLYASPYLVTNKKGYTKHYYAESERIASRIGGGGLQDLHKGFENYPDMVGKHKKSSAKLFHKVMECLDADALPQEDALKYLYEWLEFVEEEKDCYWYHPDHLGSSSWITYTDGSAVQHLHYLPWGEDFVDQRNTSWNAMYTFSAKEKDTETGYSYFGSRYYNSDLSIWLSVDPMASKYPSLSAYTYCANNPVRLVDPNGESVWITGDDGQKYEYRKDGELYLDGKRINSTDGFSLMAQSNLTTLREKSPTANKILDRFIENDKFNVTIEHSKNDDSNFNFTAITIDNTSSDVTEMTGTITWNPYGKGVPVTTTKYTGELEYNGLTALIHEFSHAFDKSRGGPGEIPQYNFLDSKEWVATYYENIVRLEMGLKLRTHYEAYRNSDGKFYGSLPEMTKDGQPFLPEGIKKFF